MTISKKGIIVNINGQRAVLRVFCPNCKSECDVEVYEFCKCDLIIECEKCGSKEFQCVFHLLYDKQFKGRVKTERVVGREAFREIYLTMPRNRKIEEGTLC
jgi:hypothetical protein